ncbi:hypothetical protein LEMLEM_LOCUS9610 [Lemmus lemmus]
MFPLLFMVPSKPPEGAACPEPCFAPRSENIPTLCLFLD